MTIEDALKDLKVEEKTPAQTEQTPRQKPRTEITKVIERYVSDIQEYYPTRLGEEKPEFKIENVQLFAPYMTFLPDLSIQIGPIPKNDLITILQEKCPEFKTLTENTDITAQIPENVTLLDGTYNAVLSSPEVQKAIYIGSLTNFRNKTREYFMIASLEFLSMFIGHGEVLRMYNDHTTQKQKKGNRKPFFESRPSNCSLKIRSGPNDVYKLLGIEREYKPLNIEELATFCATRKVKNVKDMIKQLSKIINALYGITSKESLITEHYDKAFIFSNNNDEAKKYMYEQLRKHNPEITRGGEQDAN